ncbi:SMP-30/gluconolactonase/LRE family protein [Hydrogenophaga sp. A37]|uniref:SMP-30/gluconolactonase/LRE family protein n=1 Tax=Hydrogenophaga sp. A37 TaxID=1945864 RepID=UPI000984CF3F|nr:SMP-30/gluconolactonase/LRE family protein [Hydrogenophaga sp. A37]OOG88473.1 strictosidine synthase [Hydrogenophaga sp. A37]
MKRWWMTVLGGLGLLAAYLLTWPVPIVAQRWQAAASPGYTGVHTANTALAALKTLDLGDEAGPEHVQIGPDGRLYTTVASGRVLRMAPDGAGREVFAETGGRVLGFDFDRRGDLIAADAMRGLLRIGADGRVSVLADRVGDQPIAYADAVAATRRPDAPERYFFTDASTRFGAKAWGGTFEASVLDILEQSATGRVLVHDPAAGSTVEVARGLSFANGIALSADEQTLLVAETGRYRVWAIPATARGLDLSAGPTGGARILLDNLPGYPDNLMRGQGDRIWVGLVKPRSPLIDRLANQPLLREMTLRLPRAWWPIPQPYGHVVAFTEAGRVVADWQDPSGAYPETTAVTETADRVYVHSLHARGLGWMPRPEGLR